VATVGATQGVRVLGLTELVRAFKIMPVQVVEEFTDELEEAAEPVRLAAQTKAVTSMRNMARTREWSAMRVGVSRRSATVWVAPQLRGGKRKNTQRQRDVFSERMQSRALDSALAENEGRVLEKVEDMLDRIATNNGF